MELKEIAQEIAIVVNKTAVIENRTTWAKWAEPEIIEILSEVYNAAIDKAAECAKGYYGRKVDKTSILNLKIPTK